MTRFEVTDISSGEDDAVTYHTCVKPPLSPREESDELYRTGDLKVSDNLYALV